MAGYDIVADLHTVAHCKAEFRNFLGVGLSLKKSELGVTDALPY